MNEAYEQLPQELKDAVRAFENGALDRIVARRRLEDFDALRRLLVEPVETKYRERAIYALGRWGDPVVVPDIINLLATLQEPSMYTTIDALGRLGTPTAREAVETYAEHPSPQIRKFVVEALIRIADPPAESTLQKMARGDTEPWVRDLADRRIKRRLRK